NALAPQLLAHANLGAEAPAEPAPALGSAAASAGASQTAIPAMPASAPARGDGEDGGSHRSASPIVNYSPDLEPLVYRFQEGAYPKRRRDLIPPRWRWMFVESAGRLGLEPRVWLYRENGRIAGHNGAIPV